MDSMTEDPCTSHLLILGGLIKGAEKEQLEEQIADIASGLAAPALCFSLCAAHQAELLSCLEGILTVRTRTTQAQVFMVSLAVVSMASMESTRDRARQCQHLLATSSLEQLYRDHTPPLFTAWTTSSSTWTSVSYEKLLFEGVMHECGEVAGYFPGLVVTIFKNILSNENDPESRLKSFILLSKMLLNTSSTLDSQRTFTPYLLCVVRDIIAPALKWKAGRTGSAIRTAAASSLWSSVVAASALPDTLLQIVTGVGTTQ